MQKKDWAQVSQSQSQQDSQGQDNKSNNNEGDQTHPNKQQTKEANNINEQSNNKNQDNNYQYKKVRNQRKNDQKKEYKPKDFMKIQALTKQIQNSKHPIKQLSIVFCHHLDEDQIKQRYSMITGVKKYRQGSYQVSFANTEDIYKFFSQKQANKDKFFIKLSQVRQNRQNRQTRPPKTRKDSYQYNKQYKQSRQPKQQKQKQYKIKQKGSYKQKQIKQQPNIFSQNRLVYDQKYTVEQIVNSVNSYNLFTLFDNIKIVTAKQQELQKCKQLANKVAKQLSLSVKSQIRGGQNRFVLDKSVQIKQKPKQKQKQKQQQNKSGGYKKHQNDKRQRPQKSRKYYLSYNNIRMYPQMNYEQILNEIKNKKIFDFYGAIRIKSQKQLLTKARQLQSFICKQLNCELIKQQKKQDDHILIISQKPQQIKNKGRIDLKQNKIIIHKGIDIKKGAEDVKNKLTKIFEQFTTLKLEYTNDLQKQAKLFIEELLKLQLIKNKGRIDLKQNKIIIHKGIDIKKGAEDVKNKLTKIFEQFTTLKLEYTNDLQKQGKLFIEELLKLELIKSGEQVKNIEGNTYNIITFKPKQQGTQPKYKQKVLSKQKPQQKQKQKYTSKESDKPKQKYKQRQTNNIFNISQTNSVIIENQINIQSFISDFEKIRKQIYTFYKLLKIQCSKPELFSHLKEIGEQLKKHKLVVKEVNKKSEEGDMMLLQVEEDGKQNIKKKIQVSHINDYLS